MDSENSPNADKGVKDLRRKFEDNEADIITDLYARHFKAKGDAEFQPKNGSKNDSNLDAQDSIGEQGFVLDMADDLTNKDRKQQQPEGRNSKFQHINGAPNPETYTKPLKDKIRYVQYIPKEARGTLEDVVNQLYHQKEIHRRVNHDEKEKNEEQQTQTQTPTRQAFFENLAFGQASQICQKKHKHAAQCAKVKETDLSLLQSKAFKYLML